jgi:hypothetical protein
MMRDTAKAFNIYNGAFHMEDNAEVRNRERNTESEVDFPSFNMKL